MLYFQLLLDEWFFFPLALHFTVHMLKQYYPFPHALNTVRKRNAIIKGVKFICHIFTLLFIFINMAIATFALCLEMPCVVKMQPFIYLPCWWCVDVDYTNIRKDN